MQIWRLLTHVHMSLVWQLAIESEPQPAESFGRQEELWYWHDMSDTQLEVVVNDAQYAVQSDFHPEIVVALHA